VFTIDETTVLCISKYEDVKGFESKSPIKSISYELIHIIHNIHKKKKLYNNDSLTVVTATVTE